MIYDSLTDSLIRLDSASRNVDSDLCRYYFKRQFCLVLGRLRRCRYRRTDKSRYQRLFPEALDFEQEMLLFEFGVVLMISQYVDASRLNAYEKNDFRQLIRLVKESCTENRYNSDFKKDVDDFLNRL